MPQFLGWTRNWKIVGRTFSLSSVCGITEVNIHSFIQITSNLYFRNHLQSLNSISFGTDNAGDDPNDAAWSLTLITRAMESMSGKRMDLKSWSIFSILDKEFLSTVRVACVFGNLGNEALMITDGDDVYAIGCNSAGCLGIGDMHSTLLPRKVEALCGKVCKTTYIQRQ